MVDASLGAAGQKLYIDGALIASTVGVTTGLADTTAYWRWGYTPLSNWTPTPGSYYIIGSLDEISIYNSQLADATILTDYNSNY